MAIGSIRQVREAVFASCSSSYHPEGEIDPLLREANLPEALIQAVIKEDKLSREHLFSLASKDLSAEELETELRIFLAKRWMRIASSDAGYLSYPHSPMNQLCIKLANLVKNPGEPVIAILMPSLRTDLHYLVGDLGDLTENYLHELLFYDFVLSDDQQKIIPVTAWFEMQSTYQQLQKDHYAYAPNANAPSQLSDYELEVLRKSVYPASAAYIDALLSQKQIAAQQNTLAGALQSLCNGLKGGSHEGTGDVNFSGEEAEVARASFIGIWNSLTDEQRERISVLQATSPVKTRAQEAPRGRRARKLQNFDAIIEAELASTMTENPSFEGARTFGQFYQFLLRNECAGQLYRKFQEILNAHFDVFAAIVINGEEMAPQAPPVRIDHEIHLAHIRQKIEEKYHFLKRYLETKNPELGARALNRPYGQSPETLSHFVRNVGEYEKNVRNFTSPSHVRVPLLRKRNGLDSQPDDSSAPVLKSPEKKLKK